MVQNTEAISGSGADAPPAGSRKAPATLLSHVLLHVLPATILVLLGISIAQSYLMQRTFEEEVQQRLNQQATLVAAALSVKTQALIDAAAAIAENDLVANGLIDFEQRATYIPVYFQRLRLPGPSGTLVSLTDYRGRTLASNAPARSYESEPWIETVMTGRPLTQIDRNGMILAFPVMISGLPEGIIVVDLHPDTLTELLSVPILVGAMAVKSSDGTVLFSSDQAFLSRGSDVEPGRSSFGSQWIAVETRVPLLSELQFIAAELRSDAFGSVTSLYRLTALAVVLSVVAVACSIVLTAWLTAKPIARFADDIGQIGGADALNHRTKLWGFAELQSLSLSFNTMLERLENTTTSRDYVDSILNSISEMLLVAGPDGRIRRCNKAFTQVMGCDEASLIDRPIDSILADQQEGQQEGQHEELRRLTRGEVMFIEGELRTASGRALPVQISSARMSGGGTSAGHRIFVLLDITERLESERLLKRRARELARSNAELQQFASVASHDLQEPLRKVQAFSDRLSAKYRDQLDEQGQDYLTRIAGATSRMQTLIVDLLAFSQVGRGELEPVSVDLNEVVGNVISDLEVRIQETNATIDTQELPTVRADPLQMRQLFQNLIGNGLKYSRPGVPPLVRIHMVASSDRGTFQIEVSDNGIGFEQAYAEQIFGIFQRLHGRSEYEGTGIGLAICRKICERHGGSIAARGTQGGGATFTVTLPRGDAVRKVA